MLGSVTAAIAVRWIRDHLRWRRWHAARVVWRDPLRAQHAGHGHVVNLADFLPRTWVWVDVDNAADRAEIARISPGLQAQLNEDLALEWGIGALDEVLPTVTTQEAALAAGQCMIVWHKHAPNNDEDALAIHGVDASHNPIAHYYDDIARRCGDEPSTCVSHELLEASIDPECDRTFTLPDGSVVAAEICDQVEGTTYEKNGVRVSNFNTRRNYGDVTGPSKLFDFLGKQTSAFQVLDGGYAQKLVGGVWVQLGAMTGYRAEVDARGLGRTARRRMA